MEKIKVNEHKMIIFLKINYIKINKQYKQHKTDWGSREPGRKP